VYGAAPRLEGAHAAPARRPRRRDVDAAAAYRQRLDRDALA
jgi:hypothetical protein